MISTDKLEDNTAFAKQENADFPILADPTQKTANAYGVLKDYGGLGTLANRWTFLYWSRWKDTGHRQGGEARVFGGSAGRQIERTQRSPKEALEATEPSIPTLTCRWQCERFVKLDGEHRGHELQREAGGEEEEGLRTSWNRRIRMAARKSHERL